MAFVLGTASSNAVKDVTIYRRRKRNETSDVRLSYCQMLWIDAIRRPAFFSIFEFDPGQYIRNPFRYVESMEASLGTPARLEDYRQAIHFSREAIPVDTVTRNGDLRGFCRMVLNPLIPAA